MCGERISCGRGEARRAGRRGWSVRRARVEGGVCQCYGFGEEVGKMYFCLVLGFVRQAGGRWCFARSRQVRARVGWSW